ncbi:hypothetical protein DID76_01145 [Candidatus Marinamargulisbacteria bacterium SCGC AG-414-C22]|nr:hypothetical protein DID76_01145 [Candidatus Marinamargulisbacteria bacterium SCGC AG-414-C22]
MKNFITIFAIVICCVTSLKATIKDGYYLQSLWGISESLDSNIQFNRVNQADMSFTTAWEGKSLRDAWYYGLKFEKWTNNSFKGIEWLHHKIYMVDPPSEIEHFSISDGFNILYFNKGKLTPKDIIKRYGVGFVFAHVDTKFVGEERFYLKGGIGGSYFSGVSCHYSLEKRLYETTKNFITMEGKVTLSYARPPISTDDNEFAELFNVGFHILLGFGSKPPENVSVKEILRYVGLPYIHHMSIYKLDDF